MSFGLIFQIVLTSPKFTAAILGLLKMKFWQKRMKRPVNECVLEYFAKILRDLSRYEHHLD